MIYHFFTISDILTALATHMTPAFQDLANFVWTKTMTTKTFILLLHSNIYNNYIILSKNYCYTPESHICALMVFSSIRTLLVVNITPTVDLDVGLNSLRVNQERRLDLPVPGSPTNTTLVCVWKKCERESRERERERERERDEQLSDTTIT